MRKNIIITGMPRSGKSTILKKIVSDLIDKTGFVTNEILVAGERTGFEIETSSGKKETLASINFKTDFKVSKYYVDVKNLNKLIPFVWNFKKEDLIYLDEIGEMELFSERFKELVLRYLDSENTCLITCSMVYSSEFIDSIKKRADVIIIEINPQNRENQSEFLFKLIKKISKAKRYSQDLSRFRLERIGSLGTEYKIVMNTDHGSKTLKLENGKLSCDCDFFRSYGICSHVIATEKVRTNRL